MNVAPVNVAPGSTNHSLNTLLLTSGRVLGSIISLATVMILSRWLSQEQYGIYQQVWLIYNTLTPILMLGLPSSITYFVPQMEARGQKTLVLQTALILSLIGLMIGSGTYIFAPPLAARLGGGELDHLLRLFFFYPVLNMPLAVVDTWLLSIRQARAAAWFNIFSSVIQGAAILLPVAFSHSLATVILALNFSALARYAGIGVYLFHRYRHIPLAWDRSLAIKQFQYAIPLGLSALVGTLTYQLDCIIVASLYDARHYAIYVNGARELPLVGIVAGSIMTVITPEFVRLYQAGERREILLLWHAATRKVAYLFFPITAFLMVFGTSAVLLLFSRRYIESAPIFRIYLLLLPLRITVYGAVLMAAGESTAILTAAVGALALNAIIIYPLTRAWGLPGASVSTIIATYALAGWQLKKSIRVLEDSWSRVFPWSDLGRILGISVLSAVLAGAATSRMPDGIGRLGAGLLIFGLIVVPLLWWLGGGRREFQGLLALMLPVGMRPLKPSEPFES